MGETDISSQRTDARKALETLAAIGNWLVDIPEGRTHITTINYQILKEGIGLLSKKGYAQHKATIEGHQITLTPEGRELYESLFSHFIYKDKMKNIRDY